MKLVKVKDLHRHIGSTVGKQVRLKDGRPYLNSGSIITERVVKTLNKNVKKLAYEFVSIRTDDTGDVEVYTEVIGDELKFKAKEQIKNSISDISCGNTGDLRDSITEIVEDIYTNPNVIHGSNTLFLAGGEDHAIHCVNVAILAAIMAVKAGYLKADVEKIVLGAALHDIGKAKVERNLLDMNYKYKTEDFLKMQKHPEIGYQLIKDKINVMSKRIILMHHVWEDYESSYNGDLGIYMSYPKKLNKIHLNGEYKDLGISIVQVADVFEAMTNNGRKYKKRKSRMEALEYIKAMRYVQFGKGVDYFLNSIAPFDVGTEVMLSNDEKAIIKEHTSMPERPIVKIVGDHERIIDLTDKRFQKLLIVSEV